MKKIIFYLSSFFFIQFLITVLSGRKGGFFGNFWNKILGQGTGGIFIVFLGLAGLAHLIYLSVKYLKKDGNFEKYKGKIFGVSGLLVIGILIFFYSMKNDVENTSNNTSKCYDVESYDYGYAIAKDQQGLIADCNYLYEIATTQKNISSKSCFCQGVSDFRSGK